MIQDQVFFDGEGDQWFARNRAVLSTEERLRFDPVLRALEMVSATPANVLEVGCSSGYRLNSIRSRFNCRVTGIEPSQAAIDEGSSRYPEVTLLRGVAHQIPVTAEVQFDLVIVNFVFHWIDRSTLLQSIAEIDRVLVDGGLLVIGDFFPVHPERVRYHHLANRDVWTYKQDYAGLFLATNLYDLVSFLKIDHDTHECRANISPRNRACIALLRKTLTGRYSEMSK